MKKIKWEGSSLKDLKNFPITARSRAGYELMNIQYGEDASDWKPMQGIGAGVKEIRIHCENEYRIIYIAKFLDVVHVLHAFIKKTQKTSKKDIDIAKTRYQAILNQHRGK